MDLVCRRNYIMPAWITGRRRRGRRRSIMTKCRMVLRRTCGSKQQERERDEAKDKIAEGQKARDDAGMGFMSLWDMFRFQCFGTRKVAH